MQYVNWNSGRRLPSPRKAQPNKHETHYPVRCSACGYERWLTRSNALKVEQTDGCLLCHVRLIGSQGGKTTLSRYGYEFFHRLVVEQQLKCPSVPEQKVEAWLKEKGIPYKRQVPYPGAAQTYFLDFVVAIGDQSVTLEINGWAHTHRIERQERDQNLQREYPGILVVIPAENVYHADFGTELEKVLYGAIL